MCLCLPSRFHFSILKNQWTHFLLIFEKIHVCNVSLYFYNFTFIFIVEGYFQEPLLILGVFVEVYV